MVSIYRDASFSFRAFFMNYFSFLFLSYNVAKKVTLLIFIDSRGSLFGMNACIDSDPTRIVTNSFAVFLHCGLKDFFPEDSDSVHYGRTDFRGTYNLKSKKFRPTRESLNL